MSRVLPIVLVLLGLGAGIGAGLVFAPTSDAADECLPDAGAECPDARWSEGVPQAGAQSDPSVPDADLAVDYVRLNNQFVIPVIDGDSVRALVVVSLTLEVSAGSNTLVFDREPRLRDAFLQVLFDFAYNGGFDGPFTQSANLATLRRALREKSQRIVGPEVRDVLIVDIVRQEV